MGIVGAPRLSTLVNQRWVYYSKTHSRSAIADYAASKAAVISMNSTLRTELDNQLSKMDTTSWLLKPAFFTSYKVPGIRTTLVCPGYVSTSLFQTIRCEYSPSDQKCFDTFRSQTHRRRFKDSSSLRSSLLMLSSPLLLPSIRNCHKQSWSHFTRN